MRITLGISLTIGEISSVIGGMTRGFDKNIVITHLSTDSREICQGDLFIALKGEFFDAESFISDVKEKGAFPITTQNVPNSITVKNTQDALIALAKHYKTLLKNLKHTIAITGSVGKTTTKEFTKFLLEEHFKTHASHGNFNNKIGLPLTILSTPKDTEILILEMGMNHIGEISELSKCASPTLSIITNIGSAHIGNLHSRENIARAKLEILDGMVGGKLIIPYGEPLLASAKNTISFSSKNSDSNVYIIYNEGNCIFGSKNGVIKFKLKSYAPYLLECLSASTCVCLEVGLDPSDIKMHFSSILDKNVRQNTFCINNTSILADYYNASFESVVAALDYLCSIKKYEHKSALLGDILELGDMASDIHYTIGKKCAECKLRALYLFGQYSDFTEAGALSGGMDRDSIFKNHNLSSPEITAKQIHTNMTANEIILFKASHAIDLGRVVSALEKESEKDKE